jgi:hypothetical protein
MNMGGEMGRKTLLPLIVTVLCSPCEAQEWAEKMFTTRSRDFGNIARGAKAEFAFELTNLYLEDVHIAGVRVSCGCTTPRIEKDTLKTYEKGAVIAHINSDRFLGNQGATITVTIDEPQYAQVQLQVKVYVERDLILEPSSVAFGNVGQGTSVTRTIAVRYTRDSDWQVVEVRSDKPHLQGKVTETSREEDEVNYDLEVTLAKDAPVGYLNEHVRLITNDPRTGHISVPVEGHVQADISVSPSSLFLGVVQPGQSVTKNIVVRGKKPFRIASIRGDCQCLQATAPKSPGPKSLYLVPITFTAGEKAGKVTPTVLIQMDASQTVLKVPAYAVVHNP